MQIFQKVWGISCILLTIKQNKFEPISKFSIFGTSSTPPMLWSPVCPTPPPPTTVGDRVKANPAQLYEHLKDPWYVCRSIAFTIAYSMTQNYTCLGGWVGGWCHNDIKASQFSTTLAHWN